MSLINDALRKAKQSPKSKPPPAAFLTGEEQLLTNSNSLVRGFLFLLALLCGAGLVWFAVNERRNGNADLQADARVLMLTPPPKPDTETSMPAPKPVDIEAMAPEPVMPAAPTEAESAPFHATDIPPVTQEVTKPAWPVLQGIFFHPQRPSALIDGRTVFAGEVAGGFLVLAISKQSVTLSGIGQTNVLSLPD